MKPKYIISLLSVLFIFYFFILFMGSSPTKQPLQYQPSVQTNHTQILNQYNFDFPIVAEKILAKLDIYQPPDETYYKWDTPAAPRFDEIAYGLEFDEEYCEKARHYTVLRADEMFRHALFFTTHHGRTRKYFVGGYGMEIMKEKGPSNLPYRSYSFLPNIHHFFVGSGLHKHQLVGKTFACTFQQYGHIPGHALLMSKDLLSLSITEYAKQYKNRPQCFSYEQFFPQSWLLHVKEQCKDFFDNQFNTQEY
mgnify:CR=1 FL=1